MEQVNPYTVPQVSQAASLNVSSAQGGGPIPPVALVAIIRTKLWVQIVGLVLYVLAGEMVLNLFVGDDSPVGIMSG